MTRVKDTTRYALLVNKDRDKGVKITPVKLDPTSNKPRNLHAYSKFDCPKFAGMALQLWRSEISSSVLAHLNFEHYGDPEAAIKAARFAAKIKVQFERHRIAAKADTAAQLVLAFAKACGLTRGEVFLVCKDGTQAGFSYDDTEYDRFQVLDGSLVTEQMFNKIAPPRAVKEAA